MPFWGEDNPQGGKDMALDMRTKRAVLKELAPAYQRASKKRKGAMLDEFIALTGYHREYASWLLRHCGRNIKIFM